MKSLFLGLCCGMLLAISAIADERSQNIWFYDIGHNGDDGDSTGEFQIAQNKKKILNNMDADQHNSSSEDSKFQYKVLRVYSDSRVSG